MNFLSPLFHGLDGVFNLYLRQQNKNRSYKDIKSSRARRKSNNDIDK